MNCYAVEIVAFIITCIALVINLLGVFSKTWWIDLKDEQYGMFTVVNCTRLCQLGEKDNEGWMVAAQVTSLVQMITLITSLVIQVIGCKCFKYQALLLNFIVLITSLFFSLLHIFILVSVYNSLMDDYHSDILPEKYVYFQTLPAGLNAIAGTVTIPAMVTMLVLFTKERKAKRDVIKEAEREIEREASVKKKGSSIRDKKTDDTKATSDA